MKNGKQLVVAFLIMKWKTYEFNRPGVDNEKA